MPRFLKVSDGPKKRVKRKGSEVASVDHRRKRGTPKAHLRTDWERPEPPQKSKRHRTRMKHSQELEAAPVSTVELEEGSLLVTTQIGNSADA